MLHEQKMSEMTTAEHIPYFLDAHIFNYFPHFNLYGIVWLSTEYNKETKILLVLVVLGEEPQ